jgi:NAD(P)-dependent dehydrogenase (short-subunit alcohol dehydrogenase family)
LRLQDKVIIVTGSTTGIGKAIALKCVEEGAKVVIHGLEEDLGREVFATIRTKNAVLHIEDITAAGAAQKLVDVAIQHFGKLDAVVNNAAWVVSSDIATTDPDFLRKVLEVNTVAPFALIRSSLPQLKKTRGSILNIGSVNAWSGEPNLLAYSISKGALTTLTRNLGDSLFRESGIRVNQINPGWVLTEKEIIRKKQQGLAEDWYKELPAVFAPAGRLLAPAEIASAAAFLLSEECGPVSGQVMDIEQYPMIGRNPPKDFGDNA